MFARLQLECMEEFASQHSLAVGNEPSSICMILTFLSTSILCFVKAKAELHLYMQSWSHRCTEASPERRHCPERSGLRDLYVIIPSSTHQITPRVSETLPLPKNAPPRTPIRQHQSPPSAPLPNLDDRLPNASIPALTRTNRIITLPHQSQDLPARGLDRQLGWLFLFLKDVQ